MVRDSQTGNMVLKLVNLLPVSVVSDILIPNIPVQKTKKIVLNGAPENEAVRPQEDEIQIRENFVYDLLPYSFTVIPLKSVLK
mgnify:FL=1